MKKVNVPTNQMARFAGKWVAIDPQKNRIVAVGETLKEIAPLVIHPTSESKKKPVGKALYSFLVPRKDEGPYVLGIVLP